MTTFKKTNKRKVSNLVKRQLPEFVLEEHPKFAEFVKSYFLFLESAEIELSSFTSVDNILLEGEGATDNFVLLERTDAFGLDLGDKIVNEELSFSGTLQKSETITGATSGATATILAEDFANSRYTISANNGFITGETVTGGSSNVTAEVKSWDSGTRTLIVINRSGTFTIPETLTGGTSSASWTTATYNTMDNQNQTASVDQGYEFETADNDIIDFTESNPFGSVGSSTDLTI